jgi:hypothetical protein
VIPTYPGWWQVVCSDSYVLCDRTAAHPPETSWKRRKMFPRISKTAKILKITQSSISRLRGCFSTYWRVIPAYTGWWRVVCSDSDVLCDRTAAHLPETTLKRR